MRFLFTTFEGGGHVPPILLVARALQSRGHEVLVLSDSANRTQAEASGLPFANWRRAPNRTSLGSGDDPLDEWRARWPPAIIRRLCTAVMTGPSLAYAEDTLETVAAFQPDLIVSNELLFGAMAAAEAANLPLTLLTANVWCFPTRADLPPFGPGFRPSAQAWAQRRDGWVRRVSSDWYQAGLPALNQARRTLRLAPLARTLDQLQAAELVVLGVSSAFDYGRAAPPGFAYAGPLGAAPQWTSDAGAEALLSQDQPNVLISFSTTAQGHEAILRRAVRAAIGLPANIIVTLGPALRGLKLPTAVNLRVVEAASHDVLVPRCQAVVTHAGHGTVVRPLMHGVPVVCIPTGRDQPENAARVVEAGAGIRLGRNASVGAIRRALRGLLQDAAYTTAARKLGDQIRAEADGGATAATLLEALAAQRNRIVCTPPAGGRGKAAAAQEGGPITPRLSLEKP